MNKTVVILKVADYVAEMNKTNKVIMLFRDKHKCIK